MDALTAMKQALTALEAIGKFPRSQEDLRSAIKEMELAATEAWMFQHDETCRTMCVDAWQVENGFEDNNQRLQKVGPLFTHPCTMESAVMFEVAPIDRAQLDSEIEQLKIKIAATAMRDQQIISLCKIWVGEAMRVVPMLSTYFGTVATPQVQEGSLAQLHPSSA